MRGEAERASARFFAAGLDVDEGFDGPHIGGQWSMLQTLQCCIGGHVGTTRRTLQGGMAHAWRTLSSTDQVKDVAHD